MKKYIFLCFYLSIGSWRVHAQGNLHVRLLWENDTFQLRKNYIIGKDTVAIHQLKFYISGIRMGELKMPGVYLVDAEHLSEFCVPISPGFKPGDTLVYYIGIDSATTVNTDWTGALDPAHGMYWAWNTGYIHWKMEGWISSSPEIHHGIYTHIGGYAFGQKCFIEKYFLMNSELPVIQIHLKKLMATLIQSGTYNIQHPGPKALVVSDWISNAIY